MPVTTEHPSQAKNRWKIIALFVAVSLVTRILSLFIDIFDVDEAAHIVGSWEWMRGGLIYTDFVNNKPPLLYIYYMFAQFLFGRGMFAVHLTTALLVVPLTAFAASAFYEHRRTGVIAGLIYLVWSAAFIGHDMLASNTELLLMMPAAWAVVLMRDREHGASPFMAAGAGALLGAAFLLKYPAALWLAAFLVVVIPAAFARRGIGGAVVSVLALFAGFALPLIAAYGYFHSRGGADDMLYWTLGNNMAYTANPILPSEAIGRAASYFLPFLVVTIPLWVMTIRRASLVGSLHRRILVLSLLGLGFIPAFWGLRFFPHYYLPFYIPLALGAAPRVSELLRRPLASRGRLFIGAGIGFWLLFQISTAYLYFSDSDVYRERNPVYFHVAERLANDKCREGSTLFVWGHAPLFYYRTEIEPASRFAVLAQARVTSYVSGNWDAPGVLRSGEEYGVPAHWDWLMEDLEASKATYILDAAPAGIFRWNRYPLEDYPRLANYVRDHYELLDEIDGVRIYRRRECFC